MLGSLLSAFLHADFRGVNEHHREEETDVRDYFRYRFNQMKDASGTIPDGAQLRALKQRAAMAAQSESAPALAGNQSLRVAGIDNTSWTSIGPGNVGGRIRAVLPIDASTVFVGSVAGGIWKTTNCCSLSTTWSPINDFMANLAAGHHAVLWRVGQCHDRGPVRRHAGQRHAAVHDRRGANAWASAFGGDGGKSAADPTKANYYYGEYVYAQVHQSRNGGLASYIYNTPGCSITDAGSLFTAPFIAPFVLDPNDADTLYMGAANLWKSTNVKAASPCWAIAGPSGGGFVSAIAVAPGNPKIVWVGYETSQIEMTTDGGTTWTQVAGRLHPQASSTRIEEECPTALPRSC